MSEEFKHHGRETGVSAGLFNLDNKSVLFQKHVFKGLSRQPNFKNRDSYPGFEIRNLDDVVTINWQDLELESGSGGVVGFKIGDQVTMRELLHACLSIQE